MKYFLIMQGQGEPYMPKLQPQTWSSYNHVDEGVGKHFFIYRMLREIGKSGRSNFWYVGL